MVGRIEVDGSGVYADSLVCVTATVGGWARISLLAVWKYLLSNILTSVYSIIITIYNSRLSKPWLDTEAVWELIGGVGRRHRASPEEASLSSSVKEMDSVTCYTHLLQQAATLSMQATWIGRDGGEGGTRSLMV